MVEINWFRGEKTVAVVNGFIYLPKLFVNQLSYYKLHTKSHDKLITLSRMHDGLLIQPHTQSQTHHHVLFEQQFDHQIDVSMLRCTRVTVVGIGSTIEIVSVKSSVDALKRKFRPNRQKLFDAFV